ncbi:cell cycle checkpoint protein RAD17 isoform X2 [Bicyclus anynana]|uniref:Cell cycle checkpoint protein RAD17 isoform X1 n=1 Tax=Bicyclus anynana TaxID=110368 RepID=A0A6J1MZT2_BICAN|nr:cell cycle checkpoint protein RAD17 isoform X1 [Bicyclus anynana]XP_052741444.1 cell cycle checkpoint protein RAD17 isoform X2 [Bicyclus anynana]
MQKEKKWFKPLFEFGDSPIPKKVKKDSSKIQKPKNSNKDSAACQSNGNIPHINDRNWMKNFDPVIVEDLAVHNKKVQEVDEWMKTACMSSKSDMLLLSGPVGCGKTATIRTLAAKYNIKITEWITPLDIEYPTEFGDYEFKVSQSKKFLEFIINSANFVSLLDNNSCKLVLVEDFPNVFIRTPSEFTDVLQQYKVRAKSPIVFICSDTHTDNKNTAFHLFSPSLKEQFNIHHIMFNSVSATGLKAALKRATEIITKKYTSTYNIPTADIIESVVNTSGGDVRSAILNLHFASLKGSSGNLETSIIIEKEVKSKTTRKKKNSANKFMSLGKDQTVSILHGVGRVLNPKELINNEGQKVLTHCPKDIIEQFLSQPSSFIGFLEENYLPHFSCAYDVDKAASALSESDFLLAEWREKLCQEYGLYTAVAGLMLSNKSPVSAWNPVRGPKNMRVTYPDLRELPLLEPNYLYKGKVLVTDYITYCKIIGNQTKDVDENT